MEMSTRFIKCGHQSVLSEYQTVVKTLKEFTGLDSYSTKRITVSKWEVIEGTECGQEILNYFQGNERMGRKLEVAV